MSHFIWRFSQLHLMIELSENQFETDCRDWWKTNKSCIISKFCFTFFFGFRFFIYTGFAATLLERSVTLLWMRAQIQLLSQLKSLICHLNVTRNRTALIPYARTRLQEYILLVFIPTCAWGSFSYGPDNVKLVAAHVSQSLSLRLFFFFFCWI